MVLKTSLVFILFIAKMWVTLVVACVITCLAICDSRSLYYKVSTGQVFGPFAEEQVLSWYRDGYFQGDQVQVSEHPSEIFLPVEELVKSHSRSFLAKPKSKGLIAKLGKKAGAVYKVQRTKLKGIANSITSVYPKPQRKESLNTHDENSFESLSLSLSGSKSANPSSTQPQEQPRVGSLQNEPPLKPSDELEQIDSIDSSPFLDSSGYSDHEQDMLAQLKRDDTPTKHPESAATPSGNPPTDYHVDHRKGDRETLKYSVKSLPKGDYALWDAEDVKSKSSAMDKLLKDFETPQLVSTENSNHVSPFAAKGSTTKQLMKQVKAVMLELLRFVAGLLMRFLPGPMQQSAALIGVLLTTSENHTVFVSLLMLGVLSLVRYVLYMMLLPSFCALLWTIAPAVQTGLKAAAIDAATFSSAKAGDIVTTVFQNCAADAPSVHAVHASVIDISPASVSTYFHDLMMTFRKLKQDDLRSAVLASFVKLNSARNFRFEDLVNVLIRAQIGLQSCLHQLASIEKEAVVVMLIVSALVVLHTALLPLVEAKLAYCEVVLPTESEETFIENEGFEDELLPTNTRGSTVSGEEGNQSTFASSGVSAPLRCVSVVALTNHVRSVSSAVFQLIVCGLFLSVLYSGVLPFLPEHSKMLLAAPLTVSLLSSVLSLYSEPRGLLPSARGSVETLSNVENWEDTASRYIFSFGLLFVIVAVVLSFSFRTDRLNYLIDLVDDEHQWAGCKRWGLDAYILSLLAHESNWVNAEKSKTDEVLIQRAAPRNLRDHAQLFTLFSAVAIMLLSAFSWMQLRTGPIWSELHSHPMNIAQAAEDVLRASRSEKVALRYGVKAADALFLRPLEWLQSFTCVLLAWSRTEGGDLATDASALFPLNTGSAHRAIIANVFNTALIITVVLILPSLLRILQAVKLSAGRTQYEVLSSDSAPTSAADGASHAQRAHITKSLRRAQHVLSSAQKDEQKEPQKVASGWSTQRLDVSAGIELQNVTAMRNGKIVLKVSAVECTLLLSLSKHYILCIICYRMCLCGCQLIRSL